MNSARTSLLLLKMKCYWQTAILCTQENSVSYFSLYTIPVIYVICGIIGLFGLKVTFLRY